jgi:hypothetical protein
MECILIFKLIYNLKFYYLLARGKNNDKRNGGLSI